MEQKEEKGITIITIEEARECLPEEYKELPDEEIAKINNFFMALAKVLVDHYHK